MAVSTLTRVSDALRYGWARAVKRTSAANRSGTTVASGASLVLNSATTYVGEMITLSGQGELELSGGNKVSVGPGHIELVEDITGKGHITRTVGSEDRVTIQIPLSDHP